MFYIGTNGVGGCSEYPSTSSDLRLSFAGDEDALAADINTGSMVVDLCNNVSVIVNLIHEVEQRHNHLKPEGG